MGSTIASDLCSISSSSGKEVVEPSPKTSGKALSTPSVITMTALRRCSARDLLSTCSNAKRNASQKFVPPRGFSIPSMLFLRASWSRVGSETTCTSALKVTTPTRSVGRVASTKRLADLRIRPSLSAVDPDRSSSRTRSNGVSAEAKKEISCGAPFSKTVNSFCRSAGVACATLRPKTLTLRLTRSVSMRTVSTGSGICSCALSGSPCGLSRIANINALRYIIDAELFLGQMTTVQRRRAYLA